MKVRGVSFHVGSGGCSFKAFKDSIQNAEQVFQMANDLSMDEMDILDIGGGFSMSASDKQNNFDVIAPKIQQEVDTIKAKYPNMTVIGEPGRLIA